MFLLLFWTARTYIFETLHYVTKSHAGRVISVFVCFFPAGVSVLCVLCSEARSPDPADRG